jgi:hypothetical protein
VCSLEEGDIKCIQKSGGESSWTIFASRTKTRWEDDIKMYLSEVSFDDGR